jgi:hypothetical protein
MFLIPLSAKADDRLRDYALKLLDFLAPDDPGAMVRLADLAYTLQVGREAMRHRVTFLVGHIGELRNSHQRFPIVDVEGAVDVGIELRGGIVSFDRLIQQVSKTTSTSIVGLLLVSAELPTIFWMLGILSFISVALMALLLPRSAKILPTPTYTS